MAGLQPGAGDRPQIPGDWLMAALLEPRPHQVTALADITRAHAAHDRTTAVMACGTGKILAGRWYAQAAAARVTVVFMPSLALLAQTLHEWRRPGGWPFDALVVCSDPTTAAGAAERDIEEGGDVDWAYRRQVEADITTDPGRAAAVMTRRRKMPLVVFSTYHSAPVVAAAQTAAGVEFDRESCDEAPRLAGPPRGELRVAVEPRGGVTARKRLFMTATPLVFTSRSGEDVLSMDDPRLFGPRAHTVSFADAIGSDPPLLVDYQVLVVAGDTGIVAGDGVLVPAAALDAAANNEVRSLLSYHHLVANAEGFAAALDGLRLPGWLGSGGRDELRIVASAKCLTEGVNVPAVDGVLFADPKRSVVSIIQAVGRALRPSPGKKTASIIIPVCLPPGADDDSELITSQFARVWSVLRALRAHDERLAAEIDSAARGAAGTRRVVLPRAGKRIQFTLPPGLDENLLRLRLVRETAAGGDRYYARLARWPTTQRPPRMVPWRVMWQDASIGTWAENQRRARKEGLLTADRAARLEQIPGWSWDREEGHWRDSYLKVAGVAELRPRGLWQDPALPSVYAGEKDSRHLPLGYWAALQRQRQRDGVLPADRAAKLETLNGWTWDGGLPADGVGMGQERPVFCEVEQHADVPEAHVEGGLQLGRWCWAVRRRKLTGRLHPALAEEIQAATPRGHKACPTFKWEHIETQGRLAYSALRQYARREGTAKPPVGHMEVLPDTTIDVYQWAARQRYLYNRDDLDEKYARWLEALPGWEWQQENRRTQPFGEPIDLGDPKWHGRPKGIAAGCKCEKCITARRAKDREYIARRTQVADPVDATAARRHLRKLEELGAKHGMIAEASGVPAGALRAIGSGVQQISRRHAEGLLAVTPQMLASVPVREGSRGRVVTISGERIDPGPTRALLADLAKRGFGPTWVARELGYATAVFHIGARQITRRTADQVAQLHARTEGITVQLGPTQRVPPLAELLGEKTG